MGRPGRSENQRKGTIGNRKRRQSSSVPSQHVPNLTIADSSGSRHNSPSHSASTPISQGIDCTRTVFTPQLPPRSVQEISETEFAPFLFMDEENHDVHVETMPWLHHNPIDMNNYPMIDKCDPFTSRMVLNANEDIEPGMLFLGEPPSPISPVRDCEGGFQSIVNDFTHLDTRSVLEHNDRVDVIEAQCLYQDLLERLTRLNINVIEQLKIQQLHGCSSNRYEFMPLSPPDPTLPIAPIIRGLQEFQDLLQNFVDLQKSRSKYELASEHPNPNLQATEFSEGSPFGSTHSLAAISMSTLPPNDSFLPGAVPSGVGESGTRLTRKYQLDVPTCLSMLMCYVNLVRLCRTVFTNIRHYFVALNHGAISIALSDIQISGVSLQGDQSLQILVLVQVVVRMLDSIGSILGRAASNSIARRNETEVMRPLIPPKLVELVISEEELDRQRPQGGGITELKEDIRKLKRALGRT